MTAAATVHVGDVGTIFRVSVIDQDGAVVDVSSASSTVIRFRKASGSTVDKTAAFTTDGTDGKIEYVGEEGFVDQPGPWWMQGLIVIGTQDFATVKESFQVAARLTTPA